jgi:3-deoxy-manno-octulosonate cytidylyltransferase (CMP-KDO synthetase)
MKTLGLIPARYASTRLPGKPLSDINGKPMIQWVYESASKALDLVFVATDDQRIAEAVSDFGGRYVLTSEEHDNGTSRCLEAMDILEKKEKLSFDVVVNVQGDEPMLEFELLEALTQCFQDESVEMSTIVSPVRDSRDLLNESEAFVVLDIHQNALYFSRSVIPFVKDVKRSNWIDSVPFYRHLGLYAYKRDALREFVKMGPSFLEIAERLEQNRWLQNGRKIRCAVADSSSVPVDTEMDLARVRGLLKED